MKQIRVATIVVSYNPYHSGFFPRCLEALQKVSLSNSEYQVDHSIILVDSHSGDGTPRQVQESFPGIKVIASKENLGYAGGNNRGFEEAYKLGAQYIAVVTQDVEVHSNWLLEAILVAETDHSIGAVQPLLLLYPEKEKINSTGNMIHYLGYGYAGDYQRNLTDYHNHDVKEIPYFSGAIALFSTKVLQEVGNFDHEMWMYNEDQDLGWRLWMHGYKNVLAPESKAFHQYEFSRSITKMYYMDRNRLLVVLQNYHWASLLLIAPVLIANEVASLILSWRGGWMKEKLATWKYFLRASSWKLLLQKRRMRQEGRTVKDREIIKRFTGKILFQDVMNPVIQYVANPILNVYWQVVKRVIFW